MASDASLKQFISSPATTPPVLFLIFNRPETTRQVFEAIRAARPRRLFIAADGPRSERVGEENLCRQTREVVSVIDWPCEVQTLFREKNLGLKTAVSEAITWFFEHVEEGIILEDDCLPDSSFFPFCSELLVRYRNDENVMMISGCNLAESWRTNDSYFFSKYAPIWGWATWRRAWNKYDGTMHSWPTEKNRIRKTLPAQEWKVKEWIYEATSQGRKNSWGYAWDYALVVHGGLSAVSQNNLIENIGFAMESTHTGTSRISAPHKKEITFPLHHPSQIAPDRAYDAYFIGTAFGNQAILARIRRGMASLVRKMKKRYKLWRLRTLQNLPRFTKASILIAGKQFLVADGPSFVSAYAEIFLNEIYRFASKNPTPYIVDCGANVGVSILYFKTLYPNAEVIAFEPDANIFAILKKNVATFGLQKVRLENAAVWNEDMTLSFAGDGADGGRVKAKEASSVFVQAVSIKKLLNRPVDFLKIDIEGAEDTVLKDIEPMLGNVHNLFVEYHSFAKQPQTLQDILSILSRTGFRYHIQSVGVSSTSPFISIRVSKLGHDNQLNIFAYRV